MLSRERVIAVINHQTPDRIPIYGWVSANMDKPITAEFGSVAAFEDHYEFDFAHLFGGPGTFDGKTLDQVRLANGGTIEPRQLRDVPMGDPDNLTAYAAIVDGIRHHKEQRGRFVYVQTPGIFEALNGVFGIENHLMFLAMYEDDLHDVYRRQAEWNRRFANNCIDLGVDMVHVSDDWGAQSGLMFSPETWWKLMYPYHKITADAVKARKCFLSLHSDGCVNAVLDGVVKLGYDVVHPYQESANMSYETYFSQYRDQFVVMGGLDVQTTIGFGRITQLKAEIERVMRRFAAGGLLFCTTHFVQDHCTLEELKIAYDTARDLARTVVKRPQVK